MPDSSAIPVRRVDDARQVKYKAKVNGASASPLTSVSSAGPRKLVRPTLPVGSATSRYSARVPAIAPIHGNQTRWELAKATVDNSHAEAFYFQKQVQSQTLMVFVLEDGEQIEGIIEWYDRNSIKLRHAGVRTLIYKSCIKYLYKSAENARV